MQSGSDYDLRTAVTFLMAGLGIGSLLAIMFAPRQSYSQSEGGSVFGAGRSSQERPSTSRGFAAD